MLVCKISLFNDTGTTENQPFFEMGQVEIEKGVKGG
jgi:hypothetical protein